jgi:hypothetical protein
MHEDRLAHDRQTCVDACCPSIPLLWGLRGAPVDVDGRRRVARLCCIGQGEAATCTAEVRFPLLAGLLVRSDSVQTRRESAASNLRTLVGTPEVLLVNPLIVSHLPCTTSHLAPPVFSPRTLFDRRRRAGTIRILRMVVRLLVAD